MKLICERDALHRAISAVVGRARGKTKIAILQHLELDASNDMLSIAATDLDTRSEAWCAAEVTTPGVRCAHAERLSQVIAGMPQGAQVRLEMKDNELHVQSGQSRYRLPTLSAADFPQPWQPINPVEFSLPCLDVKAMFGEPQPAIKLSSGFLMLEGGCLHQFVPGCLAMVATDKTKVISRSTHSDAPLRRPYIVPKSAMAEIVRIAHEGEVAFVVADNTIAATAGNVTFWSKLIQQEYPIDQIRRVVPALEGDSILIDRAEFAAALKRLTGLETEYSRVRLSWCDGVGELQMSLTGEGSGQEQIACECEARAGALLFQSQILMPMVEAFKGDVIRLYPRGPEKIMRMHDPSDETLIVMAMPCKDMQPVAPTQQEEPEPASAV